MDTSIRPRRRWPQLASIGAISALVLSACTGGASTAPSPAQSTAPSAATSTAPSGSPAPTPEALSLAYLSFAVTNTYDEPMLAAAEAAAAARNATIQVFDANNDPAAQTKQLQDAVAAGTFDGILTQPIVGAALAADVTKAIGEGAKIANVDQVLGADMTTSATQVDGLLANVVFVPSDIGRKMGELTIQACAQANADPCNVGYMYAFQGYPLDTAIKTAFDTAIASNASVKVVADAGDARFNAVDGRTVAQDMLAGSNTIHVIVGSDQAITGALQAIGTQAVLVVGYGGGKVAVDDVAAGKRYATVMQLPATEGRLATEQLIDAIRTGTPAEGVDPVAALPEAGIVTQANASMFTPEWPG
jgi:ribose transport system substrate-binding protein